MLKKLNTLNLQIQFRILKRIYFDKFISGNHWSGDIICLFWVNQPLISSKVKETALILFKYYL